MRITSHGDRDAKLPERAETARPATVLLVEDDSELRSLIAAVLRRDRFDVEVVEDGSAALERLGSTLFGDERANAPDLLITDFRMPRFDGFDLIEALRLTRVRTPIILITAFGDAATHARARELGVAAVLDKPFDLQDLLSLVRGATEARRGAGPAVGREGSCPG